MLPRTYSDSDNEFIRTNSYRGLKYLSNILCVSEDQIKAHAKRMGVIISKDQVNEKYVGEIVPSRTVEMKPLNLKNIPSATARRNDALPYEERHFFTIGESIPHHKINGAAFEK